MIKLKWLAAPLMAICCTVANATNLPDFPFVLVKGEATSKVAPDMATITFELIAYEKEANKAMDVVNVRGVEVVTLLKKYDVKLSDIQSFALYKEIRRQRNKDYEEGKIIGYEVSQSFDITLRNLADYSEIMDQLIGMKNLNDVNISFDVSNRKQLVQALVKKAANDAKLKASDLASGLGAELGSVYAATQDSSYNNFFARFGVSESSYSGRIERMAVSGSILQSPGMNMFTPETIELNKSIHVVYKLK
ncbi:SIMPL domain-containing protein [Psychrobium sp. MM17-31]|uniref:SIMPL domain-containing protein n=1 Tax=Psychrobium sp. MM17-31 TaxID=2917758 RepID=UPI001EF702A2|nr:SIMPL domain-containing protein [Psychrobium sp. MM17-31]MCG7531047.1 SIMPL domain-containing protein [Psychrobium sp. MM17-31]